LFVPSRLEVLDLVRASGGEVALVIALTKVDRFDGTPAQLEEARHRIQGELYEHGVVTEEYGGDVPLVPISAPSRRGLDDLVERLLVQAEARPATHDTTPNKTNQIN
jgi:translation initiation factor IF-2